jgi:transcriptional regulator with XRE-family HTH domain
MARTKGHWPKGKPRNTPIAPARVARVRRFFAEQRVVSGRANDRSFKRVAAAVGVSDRTLRRWVSGERNPTADLWRDLIAHLEELGW